MSNDGDFDPKSEEKVVATAGTPVVLKDSRENSIVVFVVIKALSTNGGLVYVGGSDVSSLNGYPLAAGETLPIEIFNLKHFVRIDLSKIYIDADVGAEGVRIFYLRA